jgi:hypothetical protein
MVRRFLICVFVVECDFKVHLFVVALMYLKNSPIQMRVSQPNTPNRSSSLLPDKSLESCSLDQAVRQGWLDEERVEVTAADPRDDVGSISSSSLTQSNLIPVGTPLSAVVAEEGQPSSRGPDAQNSTFWSKTDLVAAFSQYQNADYLRCELQGENLPLLKKSVEELKNEIQKIPSHLQERWKLEKLASNLIGKIDAVIDGRKTYVKFSTKAFFALASMSLCVLPLMVAEKNKYNQVLAAMISGYTKTMLILMGLMISRTANSRTFVRHLKERHVPYLTPNIPFAFSTYNQSVSGFNKENPWVFNGMAAAFCAVVFMATSSPNTFKKPIERVFNQTKSFVGGGNAEKQEEVPKDLLSSLETLFDETRARSHEFLSRRQEFEHTGQAISDVLGNQVNDIHRAYELLSQALLQLFKPEDVSPSTPLVVDAENPDFSKKMVFAVLAALLCIGSAATVYDEPVGLVGAGVDAALTTGEMLKTAFRPTENLQRASEKFGSYSGLTPFFLIFGLANKLPKKHFADSIAGLTVGTVMLIAATMTLPRVTSEMLSKSVLNLLNRMKKPANDEATSHVEGASENV